jgi:hypothetical protein
MLCGGARRLAILIGVALCFVAIPFVMNAHIRPLPAVAGAIALGLLLGALVPLRESRRLIRLARQPSPPTSVEAAYRANPREPDTRDVEDLATREAAVALLLLSLSAALVIVAAAAR